MNGQIQFGKERPVPRIGLNCDPRTLVTNQTAPNQMQVQSPASGFETSLVQTNDRPKDYTVSVDDIRLLLFENGIEKSKDTIQRYCREGRLDAVKLGLLRRYFATPLSVELLLEYLRTDAIEVDPTELDAAAPTGMQAHAGADSRATPDLRLHQPADPSKPTPELELHEAAPTRTQAHTADYNNGMVDFLKDQIDVKDEQIKVKDTQIAAMLERDRETNILIRELQTQLSNTFRLVADGREDTPKERNHNSEQYNRHNENANVVENPIGQSDIQ